MGMRVWVQRNEGDVDEVIGLCELCWYNFKDNNSVNAYRHKDIP